MLIHVFCALRFKILLPKKMLHKEKNRQVPTIQLKPNESENIKLYVCQTWDVGTWQFFRHLKVEQLLNPLCSTVSFSQHAASPYHSKIVCLIMLVQHIHLLCLCSIFTQGLSSLRYNAQCARMCKFEPKSYSFFLLELPWEKQSFWEK